MRTLAASLLSLTVLASGAIVAGITSAEAASSGQVVSLRRLTQEEYRNSIADIFGKEIEVRLTVKYPDLDGYRRLDPGMGLVIFQGEICILEFENVLNRRNSSRRPACQT